MTEFASAATRRKNSAARLAIGLLAGTMLAGMPAAAFAQDEDAATPSPAPAPATPQDGEGFVPTLAPATAQQDVVQTIAISGAERLEPNTILSYIKLRPGDVWTQAAGDQVLKDLSAT